MPEYFIAYHTGEGIPEKPEEHMDRFMEWVSGLGEAVVMPGMPLGRAKVVSADGVSDEGGTKLTGFSIVEADNLEAAVEMTKTCPHLVIGPVEVVEMQQVESPASEEG